MKNNYRKEAQRWLKLTRERALETDVKSHVQYIHEAIAKGHLKLKDIGTSEQELSQLLKAGYKAGAIHWLERFRKKGKGKTFSRELMWILEYVKKAGLKLEDIGTSDKELKELADSEFPEPTIKNKKYRGVKYTPARPYSTKAPKRALPNLGRALPVRTIKSAKRV